MSERIYFDNNATTRPLPEVIEAVTRSLRDGYANPSSVHRFGQSVRHDVECARAKIASMIGASEKEIVFTSGGTESINLAIRGALGLHPTRRRIVTSAVEHSAVLRVMERLADEGYVIETIGVDESGRLREDEWREKMTEDTALASVMHANNETGVLFDVGRLAGFASERGVPVHVDAVQSAGKLAINVSDWPVQFVSLSGHKFHGPKGAGALFVRRRTRIEPMILGGGQERMLRGGTENVASILGMGVAAEIAVRDLDATARSVGRLRDDFEAELTNRIGFARINGANASRIHNTSNVSFEDLEAEAILLLLSEAEVCASSGAACSSGSLEPSHVLKAMGIEPRWAHGAVRFSFSRFNTSEEVEQVLTALPELLSRLTSLSRVVVRPQTQEGTKV